MWQSCDGGFNAWCFAVIPVSLWLACIMAVRFCVGRWQQCCSIMILWAGDLWMDLSSVFFIGNIMNLERIPNEEKLSLCRRYYLGMLWQWDIMTRCDVFSVILVFIVLICSSGGFAFLPFLWLVNVLWFFREAFLKPTYTEQLQIKSCEYVTEHAWWLTVSHDSCSTTLLWVIFFLAVLPTVWFKMWKESAYTD